MFEKNMKIAYLLDFYGEALDERCGSILRSYYEDDLSLAEIAAGENISRQGVRHIIKKGEESLEFLEEKLGLAAHYAELISQTKKLEEVKKLLTHENNDKFNESLKVLDDVIFTILNKGI